MIHVFTTRLVLPGLAVAGSFVGAASVMLGQAIFDPVAQAAERVVGGTVLAAVGYLVVRWTFRLLREARENAAADREASLKRETLLLEQLEKLTAQLAEANAQLAAERQLRISLEQRGFENRRSNGYDD